jgi:transcriptional regulator of aromatic amino acid metabolism
MKCTWGSGDSPREHTTALKGFVSSQAIEVPHSTQQEEGKGAFSALVGQSISMQEVYQQIRDVAQVDASVLIEGETRTGKELVARAIHNASLRKNKPFRGRKEVSTHVDRAFGPAPVLSTTRGEFCPNRRLAPKPL